MFGITKWVGPGFCVGYISSRKTLLVISNSDLTGHPVVSLAKGFGNPSGGIGKAVPILQVGRMNSKRRNIPPEVAVPANTQRLCAACSLQLCSSSQKRELGRRTREAEPSIT